MFEDGEEKAADKTSEESEDTEKESEDTEEEESAEEEEEKGEDDDTEEEGDDSEESEDSEEEEAPKNFMDPRLVKPELRPHLKKMQAIFTKAMQGISNVKRKAIALDRLMMHPDFQEFLKSKQEESDTPNNGKRTSKRSRELDDEDDGDEDKPLTKAELRKMIRDEVRGGIEPVFRERQEKQDQKEAREFKKKYPDWELYREQMFELIDQNPNLTYRQAYKLASEDDNEEMTERERIIAKKRAKTQKPSPTGGKEVKKKGKLSFLEAAMNAVKQTGVKWEK